MTAARALVSFRLCSKTPYTNIIIILKIQMYKINSEIIFAYSGDRFVFMTSGVKNFSNFF